MITAGKFHFEIGDPPPGYVSAAQKDYGHVWVREAEMVTYECGDGYCWREKKKRV